VSRLLGAVLLIPAWIGAVSAQDSPETFYRGESEFAPVFTNIPQGGGMEPLPGFGKGGTQPVPSRFVVRSRAFDDLIESTARSYGLQPDLVRALIQVESAFDPGAISPKGARGLMQLMPETAKQYNVHNLFDPLENIRAGVRHLVYLGRRYGDDLDRVLAAYNAGEEAVRRYNGIPDYDETRHYVRRIKKLYSGPIFMGTSAEVRRPAFFTYEDSEGVLHVSDRPVTPATTPDEPCGAC